jgi:hypothetical protein
MAFLENFYTPMSMDFDHNPPLKSKQEAKMRLIQLNNIHLESIKEFEVLASGIEKLYFDSLKEARNMNDDIAELYKDDEPLQVNSGNQGHEPEESLHEASSDQPVMKSLVLNCGYVGGIDEFSDDAVDYDEFDDDDL